VGAAILYCSINAQATLSFASRSIAYNYYFVSSQRPLVIRRVDHMPDCGNAASARRRETMDADDHQVRGCADQRTVHQSVCRRSLGGGGGGRGGGGGGAAAAHQARGRAPRPAAGTGDLPSNGVIMQARKIPINEPTKRSVGRYDGVWSLWESLGVRATRAHSPRQTARPRGRPRDRRPVDPTTTGEHINLVLYDRKTGPTGPELCAAMTAAASQHRSGRRAVRSQHRTGSCWTDDGDAGGRRKK
jgi:hypothetical protein